MGQSEVTSVASLEDLAEQVRALAGEIQALRRELVGLRAVEAEQALSSVTALPSETLLDYLTDGDVDFIDLGCSHGGSINHAMRKFGLSQGIGVDIDPAKVASARTAGNLAVLADATNLDIPEGSVRLVQGLHFLEHLPSRTMSREVIDEAIAAATEAVYFRQPYFDADDRLHELGLKLYWSDWHGHPSHVTISDFVEVMREARQAERLEHYAVFVAGDILDSHDDAVLPLGAPRDQHRYDPAHHSEKAYVPFPFAVHRETIAVGLKRSLQRELGGSIAASLKGAKLVETSMSTGEIVDLFSMLD